MSDEHVMYIDQSFTAETVDVGCSCGWEAAEFEDVDAATDAWDNHCDVAFMEATLKPHAHETPVVVHRGGKWPGRGDGA